MITNAYSVYDNKALVYSPPFFTHNDAAAIRSLSDAVSDSNTQVGRHPGDFVLFFVGIYDDSKGMMVPESPLRHVIDAAALIKIQTQIPLFNQGA